MLPTPNGSSVEPIGRYRFYRHQLFIKYYHSCPFSKAIGLDDADTRARVSLVSASKDHPNWLFTFARGNCTLHTIPLALHNPFHSLTSASPPFVSVNVCPGAMVCCYRTPRVQMPPSGIHVNSLAVLRDRKLTIIFIYVLIGTVNYIAHVSCCSEFAMYDIRGLLRCWRIL